MRAPRTTRPSESATAQRARLPASELTRVRSIVVAANNRVNGAQKPVLLVGAHAVAAAEMIASEIRGALKRVDLSAVVSKYIGETESNLKRVFAEAEAGGALLLFDQAEALFGKRTTVKDAHGRFAEADVLLSLAARHASLVILVSGHTVPLPASLKGRLTIRKFPPRA